MLRDCSLLTKSAWLLEDNLLQDGLLKELSDLIFFHKSEDMDLFLSSFGSSNDTHLGR